MTPEIVLTREEIDEIITKCANELNSMYQNSDKIPVLIGVLKGALPFMMDLIKKLNFDFIMDFIQVTSYSGTSSTGVIHLKKDITTDIRGKDVVIVEDIIDSGITLNYLKGYLKNRGATSVKICALLDKPTGRQTDVQGDYVGFTVGDVFIVGYGLDYNQKYRQLPYISCLD